MKCLRCGKKDDGCFGDLCKQCYDYSLIKQENEEVKKENKILKTKLKILTKQLEIIKDMLTDKQLMEVDK